MILMPSVAETMLGAHLYETFLVEQHKKVSRREDAQSCAHDCA